jgi:hypothetical protein
VLAPATATANDDSKAIGGLIDDGSNARMTIVLSADTGSVQLPGPLSGLSDSQRMESGDDGQGGKGPAAPPPPAGSGELLVDETVVPQTGSTGLYLMVDKSCAPPLNGDPNVTGVPYIFAADGVSPVSSFAVFATPREATRCRSCPGTPRRSRRAASSPSARALVVDTVLRLGKRSALHGRCGQPPFRQHQRIGRRRPGDPVAFLGERATVVGRRVRPLGMGRSRPDLGGAECDRPQPVSVGAPGLCEDWRQNAAGWAQFRRICLRRRSNEISQNAIIAPRPDVRPVAQSSCGPMTTTFATQRTSAAPGNPSDRRMLAARSSLNDRHVSA